jgi:predicted nuclease of restriction endonuclease-like RecB superfamily
LLPEKLIPARIRDGQVELAFLGADDLPWLSALLELASSFEGRPARELSQRLQTPLPLEPPFFKARAAAWLVKRFWRAAIKAAIRPPIARSAAFAAAARSQNRDQALAEAAEQLGATIPAIEESLFADLPGERIVHRPADPPDAQHLALRTNLLCARSLLQRAASVSIRVEGEIQPLVRLAKQKGLLCTVDTARSLQLSGPYALFRRTLLYGRALGDLLPGLAAYRRFDLRAECQLRGQLGELRLSSEAPVFCEPSRPAGRDRWQERLAAELTRRDWQATADPAPILAGDQLLFPDLVARHSDGRWFHLEVLGFWTPEHAQRLLPLERLILCVDEERGCGDGAIQHPRLVRYRKKIDVAALLEAVDAWSRDAG